MINRVKINQTTEATEFNLLKKKRQKKKKKASLQQLQKSKITQLLTSLMIKLLPRQVCQ